MVVVARAEQQGPSVERADRLPMVTQTVVNWQKQRLTQETGVVFDTRLVLITYRRASPSVKEIPEAPRPEIAMKMEK